MNRFKIVFLIPFLLIAINGNSVFDISTIEEQLKKTSPLLKSNPDSLLVILKEIQKDSSKTIDYRDEIEVLLLKSNAHQLSQEYTAAYNSSKEAVKLSERTTDTLMKIKTYMHYGKISFVVFQEDESITYQNKGLELSKIMHVQKKYTDKELYNIYLSIMQRCIRFQKYYEAFRYLEICCQIFERNSFGELNGAYLNSNKAFLLLKMNEIDESLEHIKISEAFFENINLDSHKAYLTTVYSLLGEIYRLKGDYKLSKKYFEKSLNNLKKYSWHHNHKPIVLENYAWLLYETGEYEKATEYLNKSKELSEKYFKAKSLSDDDFKTVEARYKGELNHRMQELISKSLEIAEKDKTLLRFRITTFMTIAIIIISLLIYRIKTSRRKHFIEKKKIKEKAKRTKELVKLKNKELTESTLKQIEKDKIINQLYDELKENPTKNSQPLLKNIDLNSKKMWEDFNNRFVSVNQDFYETLHKKFPNLTPNDLKICALLKLNFSTKEMARLLGVSTESLQKARYRLRKKLNVSRETNLVNYISSI